MAGGRCFRCFIHLTSRMVLVTSNWATTDRSIRTRRRCRGGQTTHWPRFVAGAIWVSVTSNQSINQRCVELNTCRTDSSGMTRPPSGTHVLQWRPPQARTSTAVPYYQSPRPRNKDSDSEKFITNYAGSLFLLLSIRPVKRVDHSIPVLLFLGMSTLWYMPL